VTTSLARPCPWSQQWPDQSYLQQLYT
jgi:hypothetical protein